MKTFHPAPQLAALLEKMSADTTVPVEALVNQALFNWARLHGYVEPAGAVEQAPAAPVASAKEPDTAPEHLRRAGVVPAEAFVDGLTDPGAPRVARVVMFVRDREIPIEGERFVIGRDVSCNLTIDSPRLSRQHAVVHTDGPVPEVEDLNSSNGTWFNGERIHRRVIEDGDEIFFGDVDVRFEVR